MEYKNLIFHEISDSDSQAVVNLDNGYKIQIIRDNISGISECNLYTPQGEVLDNVENECPDGVNYFIKQSFKLMEDIKFWDSAMEESAILVENKQLLK